MAITTASFPADDEVRALGEGGGLGGGKSLCNDSASIGAQGAVHMHAGDMTPRPMHPGTPVTDGAVSRPIAAFW